MESTNPELNRETEKNFVELFLEDLKVREAKALKKQRHVNVVVLESKKIVIQEWERRD